MEEQGRAPEAWTGYVDWRNRPTLRGKHGGTLAASFVLAVEVLENLAYLANASNLVTYLTGYMNFSPARAATAVTNFMGTAFMLALLGGFLSDAFFTAYHIYLSSAAVEFLIEYNILLLRGGGSQTAQKHPCHPLTKPAKRQSVQQTPNETSKGTYGPYMKGICPNNRRMRAGDRRT